jgi:hypothetical protein
MREGGVPKVSPWLSMESVYFDMKGWFLTEYPLKSKT